MPSRPAREEIRAGIAVEASEDGEEIQIRAANRGQMLRWIAALASAGLEYRFRSRHDSWEICVPTARADVVLDELAEYEWVNWGWPPVSVVGEALDIDDGDKSVSLGVTLALLLFFVWTGPFDSGLAFGEAGVADADLIASGEWWRAVTALTLHADLPHILGNALCCFFFGGAVARRFGYGLGWSMVLLTGIAGNLVAARFGPDLHRSVGASTAMFGAIGLLAVVQFIRNYRVHGDLRSVWHRSWLAASAGIAILGLLGTGQRADLLGHFYGFLAGVVLGVPAASVDRRRLNGAAQAALFCVFVAVLVGGWMWALAPR